MSPWSGKKSPDPKRGTSPNPTHSGSPTHSHQTGWAAKALKVSDKLGGKFNDYTDRWGIEAFWPTSGDMPREMEKAARILKSFTIPDPDPDAQLAPAAPVRIPPSVIGHACGLAIYSCFRTGWAPVGGGGGSGVVIARLPDGSWSAPAAICPTAVGAGIGIDVYSAVLVIRSEKALAQFGGHRVALGGEISVAAGPYGGGKGVDKGLNLDTGPEVYAYMHSRGAYFGLEVVGTVFVSRADENAAMYHWPGIKASDILSGRVRVPPEASSLMQTLRAAETGVAQCPNVAGYGPEFGASGIGHAGHGPEHVPYSAYDHDEKSAHKHNADSGRSLVGQHSGAAGPSTPRAQAFKGKAVSQSKGTTQASGARFVPPLPTRGTSPAPADSKGDAPPPYSPGK